MKATVVADSLHGILRLTTLLIEMPSALLPDLLAIREVSVTRKRASTITERINAATEPYEPRRLYTDPMSAFTDKAAHDVWYAARVAALQGARELLKRSHVPPLNYFERLLQPFGSVTIVATSTNWRVVLDQLADTDDPDLSGILLAISTALAQNSPNKLAEGEWHLPFVTSDDIDVVVGHVLADLGINPLLTDTLNDHCHSLMLQLSVARCLRREHDTHPDVWERVKNDLALFSSDLRFSVRYRPDAYDHQATPDTIHEGNWRNANLHGNLVGWCQNRQIAKWELWRRVKV